MKNLGWLFLTLFCILVVGNGFSAKLFANLVEKDAVLQIPDMDKYKNLTLTDRVKNESKFYFVEKGDSINRIASLHKILPWQLRKANGMGMKDTFLQPDQKLIIPNIVWRSYVGRASWYGPGFNGKKMANGQIYDQNEILVAHRTLPLGLKVRITNLENSKSIVTRILDRGPYTKKNGKYDREFDLSLGAAEVLGSVKKGIISVRITPLQG